MWNVGCFWIGFSTNAQKEKQKQAMKNSRGFALAVIRLETMGENVCAKFFDKFALFFGGICCAPAQFFIFSPKNQISGKSFSDCFVFWMNFHDKMVELNIMNNGYFWMNYYELLEWKLKFIDLLVGGQWTAGIWVFKCILKCFRGILSGIELMRFFSS